MVLRLRSMMRNARIRARALRIQLKVLLRGPSNRGRRMRQSLTAIRCEIGVWRGLPTIAPFATHSRLYVRKGGDSSWRVAFSRLPDWPEMNIWSSYLKPGVVFCDVGANVGLYTLMAAELECSVVSVEPAVDMLHSLRANLELNGLTKVRIEPVACMNQVGFVGLSGPDANQRVATIGNGGTPATTIDLLLDGEIPAGIKIDVEGNERLVLEGAKATLSSHGLDLIQLEWNDTSLHALSETREPVAEILYSYGFALFQVKESGGFAEFTAHECPPFGRDVFAARNEAVRLFAN